MLDYLLGHQKNKDILNAMLQSDRFPSVLLLYGHDGVGKADFARAISKAIIGMPRDQSHHPDFLEFFPDTKTGLYSLQGIRAIVQATSLFPFSAKYKILLLNQLDCVEEGGNALLKIFEEPPKYVRFICISSKKESILPTLLSRMHTLAFHSLSLEEITFWIYKMYKKNESDTHQIALFSSGSLAKAKLLCEIDIHALFSLIKRSFLCIQEKKLFFLYERIEDINLYLEKESISLEDLHECIITWLHMHSLPDSYVFLEKCLQLSNVFIESSRKLVRKKVILEWFFFSLFSYIHQ